MSPARKIRTVPGILPAAVAAVTLSLVLSARADDWTDCNGTAANKVESACSVVIGDAMRPAPDKVRAYLNRARVYLNSSRVDRALADAEAALKLDPRSVRAADPGVVLGRKGNTEAARGDFDRALQIEPKNIAVLQARGNLFIQQKKWAEAIADDNNVIAARQDIAPVYIGRGRAFVEMGLADAAINELDRALAINVERADRLLLARTGLSAQG